MIERSLRLLGVLIFFLNASLFSFRRWTLQPIQSFQHSNTSTVVAKSTTETEEASAKSRFDNAGADVETVHRVNATTVARKEKARKKESTGIFPLPQYTTQTRSTVFYRACCGLGHRLIRMSSAYHVARRLGYQLKPNWGYCGEQTKENEIFSQLFGPENGNQLAYVNSTGQGITFRNEVPGFLRAYVGPLFKFRRKTQPKSGCYYTETKAQTDLEFYTSLRDRFLARSEIDGFVNRHFVEKTVFGIHIRAGNGETGHFNRLKRGIGGSPEEWVSNVSKSITEMMRPSLPPPVLYVATDTDQFIELFRSQLDGIMPVVDWSQDRPKEGEGVFFGEFQQASATMRSTNTTTCLQRWKDTLYDMLLLSHVDVLIAGQSSSFTQSLPLSIVFGRTERKLDAVFCEVAGETIQKLRCYESYQKWACDTKWHNGKYAMLPLFPETDSEDWKNLFPNVTP